MLFSTIGCCSASTPCPADTGSAATGTATPNIIAALNTNDKNFFVFIRLPPLK